MSHLSKDKIARFIVEAGTPVTKREIARAFNVKGGDVRIALKRLLNELEKEGVIEKQPWQAYGAPQGLPAVAVLEVADIDIDGDVLARPVEWDEALRGPPPRIEVMPDKKGHPALQPGDRMLAALKRLSGGDYEARPIRRLDTERYRVLGMMKTGKGGGGWLVPADKKAKDDFQIAPDDMNGAQDGDLVLGEIQPSKRGARKKARVAEVIGRRDDPKAISLISLHEMGLREAFPDPVLKDCKGLKVPPLEPSRKREGREDLRDVPLVTIDGADARDFDDAVFAEKTEQGHRLIVAIADVAYYVRPGSPLDLEAYRRGNSTYFPDRVVPMLPEALSNDLCSLRPDEPRACLAVHLWIDGNGILTKHKFVRGLMTSRARLTYEQVQAARDGHGDAQTEKLLPGIIAPLYEAYEVLAAARQKRGALDLDLPERQILLDDKGNMTGVKPRVRLDSHRLIEEFMILANVAAARALEARKAPCVYRVHDRPSMEKLESARDFLQSFGLSLPKGQVVQPAQLNQLLTKAAKHPYSHLVSQSILRTQAQAHYAPQNIGHFGLALERYAHFTSPIRRYADLLVHRSLIGAYGLGPGPLDEGQEARLEEMCDHISTTERISMEAERNAVDRFTAAFLSSRIGAEFSGRITGVTRFGLFVELAESGADGLVPMRSLPDDFYIHDEKAHALIGRRHKRVYRLGAPVSVRLTEADGLTGSTLLELAGHERGADIPGMELQVRSGPPSRQHRRQKPGKERKKKAKGRKKGRR